MGEGLDLGMFGENFENASSGNRAMSNDNGVDAGVEQITNILSSKNKIYNLYDQYSLIVKYLMKVINN